MPRQKEKRIIEVLHLHIHTAWQICTERRPKLNLSGTRSAGTASTPCQDTQPCRGVTRFSFLPTRVPPGAGQAPAHTLNSIATCPLSCSALSGRERTELPAGCRRRKVWTPPGQLFFLNRGQEQTPQGGRNILTRGFYLQEKGFLPDPVLASTQGERIDTPPRLYK